MGSDTPKKPKSDGKRAKLQYKDGDMGLALRSVYQQTVEEQIPSEMLDLLKKLG